MQETHEATELRFFNGTIYNAPSDTSDFILKMYAQHGTDCVKHFRGTFAFALYDKTQDLLFLARDPLGQKPLYYYFDGANFFFADRIDDLLAHSEVKTKINFALIDDFLTFNYIPSDNSVFENIYKVPAGHILTFQNQQITLKKYWDIDYRPKLNISLSEALVQTEELLRDAVTLQTATELPLGAHLSGGVDSSLITALMAERGTVKTFSIGFEQKDFNELTHAKIVADYLQTNHTEFIVTPDAIGIMPELIDSYDEPNADPSQIPMHYLCRLTKEKVSIALNGDGGDESFGGYERYLGMLYQSYFRKIPKVLRQSLYRAVSGLPENSAHRSFVRRLKWLCKVSLSSEAESYLQADLSFSDALKNKLYTDKMLRGQGAQNFVQTFLTAPANNLLDKMLYTDFKLYLNHDLLVKADRSAARHSLEGRSPLLDIRLMEFAAGLPDKYKIHKLQTKYLLKKISEKYLPKKIIYRKKQGFGVPLNNWFRNGLKQYTESLFNESILAEAGYFNRAGLLNLLAEQQNGVNHGRRLFALVILENWLKKYRSYIG